MVADYVKPFHYTIPWKSSSVHYGDHKGTQRGLGDDYRGNVSLIDYPDAKRMDVRASMRDPYENIQVKTFKQDNTTPIYAVCDASSSMQFKGKKSKLAIATEIASSVAYSAYEMSDIFSFVAYHDHVIEELTLPLSHQVFNSLEVISELQQYSTKLTGSEGITDLPFYLGTKRSLVFWISDFHMPIATIEKTLNAMSAHQVVPVVLWDEQEYQKLPKFGFGNLIDPETSLSSRFFFRQSLREQFIEAFEKRREALNALFLKFDYPALFVNGEYKPESFTDYFEENMS